MGNILSNIAQRILGRKAECQPHPTDARTPSPAAVQTSHRTACSSPVPNLTHIDLPQAPTFGIRSLTEVRTAAENGDAEAQYQLFDYYASGHKSDDDQSAMEWLTKAAEQGYPLALYTSALIQIEEKGGKVVPPQAIFYLQASGERGFSDAYLQLYHLYYEGKGVEANEDTALGYLRQAMEAGSGAAYLIVAKGFLPNNGGGPIDYDAAYYYAEQAAHLGSQQAVELIIHLLEENLASGDHTELLTYWRRQLRPAH
ncbi:tetratricopeptide repeat protein [Porphyromonas sp.]